jgi:hypothetical protein
MPLEPGKRSADRRDVALGISKEGLEFPLREGIAPTHQLGFELSTADHAPAAGTGRDSQILKYLFGCPRQGGEYHRLGVRKIGLSELLKLGMIPCVYRHANPGDELSRFQGERAVLVAHTSDRQPPGVAVPAKLHPRIEEVQDRFYGEDLFLYPEVAANGGGVAHTDWTNAAECGQKGCREDVSAEIQNLGDRCRRTDFDGSLAPANAPKLRHIPNVDSVRAEVEVSFASRLEDIVPAGIEHGVRTSVVEGNELGEIARVVDVGVRSVV